MADDEEAQIAAQIAWQDVLDMVVAGRPNDLSCPYCSHRPLLVEEQVQDNSTKISCTKCKKFIQGRFSAF